MIFNSIKNLIQPNFCKILSKWESQHKCKNESFHKDVLFCFDISPESISILVYSKSGIMDNFGITGGIKKIFTTKVNSIGEGLNQITIEASNAKTKYPNLNYFLKLDLSEAHIGEYIKKKDRLSSSQKTNMILSGSTCKNKTVSVFEKYSSGTWTISNVSPWETEDVDSFGDRYDGEVI